MNAKKTLGILIFDIYFPESFFLIIIILILLRGEKLGGGFDYCTS